MRAKIIRTSIFGACLVAGGTGLWATVSGPSAEEQRAESRMICQHLAKSSDMWALSHRAAEAEAHLTEAKNLAYTSEDPAWRDISGDVAALEERCEELGF